jgi:hypothetical protein
MGLPTYGTPNQLFVEVGETTRLCMKVGLTEHGKQRTTKARELGWIV